MLFQNLIRRLTVDQRRELLHILRSIPSRVATPMEFLLMDELRNDPQLEEWNL
jgi:hypothetical protein